MFKKNRLFSYIKFYIQVAVHYIPVVHVMYNVQVVHVTYRNVYVNISMSGVKYLRAIRATKIKNNNFQIRAK